MSQQNRGVGIVDPKDGNNEEHFKLYIWHQNINQRLRNWNSDPCPALDPGPELCFGHFCRLNLCYWPLPGSLALRQTNHLFNPTWQVLCSVMHDAFPGTSGFHLKPNSQVLVSRLKCWGSCFTPCHICWSCWVGAGPSIAIFPHLYGRQSLSGIPSVCGVCWVWCCSRVAHVPCQV